MKLMRVLLFTILLGAGTFVQAQINLLQTRLPADSAKPVLALPLFSDPRVSSFLLEIKKEVKPHKHSSHSEHVYVISGKATVKVGSKIMHVVQGDLMFIPQDTVHSVIVTDVPFKVMSIQAPYFDGKDRILME